MTPQAPGHPTDRSFIFHGDCIPLMGRMPESSVDFILTDPPYLIDYHDRYDGRRISNDDNDTWLRPAFSLMHRVLKDGGFCVSFYATNHVDRFMAAWREAGFRTGGHFVFRKRYSA